MFIVTSSSVVVLFESAYKEAESWQEKRTGLKQAIMQAQQNYQQLKDKQEPTEKLEEAERNVKNANEEYERMETAYSAHQFYLSESARDGVQELRGQVLELQRAVESREVVEIKYNMLNEVVKDVRDLSYQMMDIKSQTVPLKYHDQDIDQLNMRILGLENKLRAAVAHNHSVNRLSQKVADLEKQMKNTPFEKIKDNTAHCFDKVKSCMKRSKKLCMKKKSQ
jgi:uncharacterized coiled-coil DUF342 family protein